MLTSLKVRNLALIESLELEPCAKLNILSGETGAGKSIIVDGIMLLLGARYDKSLLRYGAESGLVEGVFDTTDRAREVMTELGIGTEDECIIIARRFFADGKNEIRINGRAATTSMLKQLMATLVDIYGQNEYQSLMKAGEHLRILDYYVRKKLKSVRDGYVNFYSEYKDTVYKLSKIGDASEREREIDLLRFQIDEINNAATYENEEDELIERRNVITSAEKIYAALGHAAEALGSREEGAATDAVGEAMRELSSVSALKNTFNELYDRLYTLSIELGDICDGINDELDNLHFDMNELDDLEKRLGFVRALKRKYGSYKDMLAFKVTSEKRLEFLENADEHYSELSLKKKTALHKLYNAAQEMHEIRVAGAVEFENKIKSELGELGMENADFKIEISEFPQESEFEGRFGMNGADTAEFYLSPNAGQPLKPLIKIISGGEMSRFMLALKVISNETDDIPTMIFDEIDAGISGITGRVVAKKLASISRRHQVLCVTHLAQIAAMADSHFYISKHTLNNSTVTNVNELDERGMINEVSRLSGGQGISDKSDGNAETMKKWSTDYKDSLS